ncbi:MAG TPA: MmgE/PrpD family protein [Xanthobacteraceae bacterium]|nr:MmgE/PrpD family protein [Xanthobacteraceae bacterium]
MSVIGELAAFVAGAKAADLPAADRERLRLHFIDTVVAAKAGARIPEGKALQSLGDDGALAVRIGRQAAAIRLTEIDDIHLPSCTTPSAGVVPVALMLAAQQQKFDPSEIASAIWAGTEIMTRIGVAVRGPQILYRGIWPTYLAAPVAAAATSARLMGLSEARTGHALSLAVMLMAGGVGRIHGAPSGRWFLYANAVAAGVAAAEAAGADYRGDPDILDKTWLTDSHGIALDRERLTEKLGVGTVYAALSLKPFCSAKQGIAAIEAFRAILDRGVRAETISKVRVRVPPAYAGMIATRAEAGARQSTMVSVAHQIALAALTADRLYDVDRSSAKADAEVAGFAAKVEIIADARLDVYYPQHWPAEVDVEANGEVHQQRIVEAIGDPEHPLDHAGIVGKAHRVLDPLVGNDGAAEWLKMAGAALDDAAACRKLAATFAAGL